MKRAIDILGGLFGLVLFSPVMLWLVWKIRREMNPPATFNQMRAGKNGVPFRLYKYRSMTDKRDENGMLLPDAQRLTPFGRRLRASSLDELPQFWNVLIGDMSLVGPRPLLLEYVPLYNKRQSKRLSVRPGITGWAQINGRNSLSWEEKFELDTWYVENQSLRLDIKIILLTIKKAIIREGIAADGEATMPRFNGSHNNNRED